MFDRLHLYDNLAITFGLREKDCIYVEFSSGHNANGSCLGSIRLYWRDRGATGHLAMSMEADRSALCCLAHKPGVVTALIDKPRDHLNDSMRDVMQVLETIGTRRDLYRLEHDRYHDEAVADEIAQ